MFPEYLKGGRHCAKYFLQIKVKFTQHKITYLMWTIQWYVERLWQYFQSLSSPHQNTLHSLSNHSMLALHLPFVSGLVYPEPYDMLPFVTCWSHSTHCKSHLCCPICCGYMTFHHTYEPHLAYLFIHSWTFGLLLPLGDLVTAAVRVCVIHWMFLQASLVAFWSYCLPPGAMPLASSGVGIW